MKQLINKSRISDKLLNDIIWFVAPADIEQVYTLEVIQKPGFYHGETSHTCYVKIYIPVKEPNNKYNFSHETNEIEGYVGCRIKNETERLVHLIAHELRHVWQRQNFDTKKGWYKTKRYKRTLTSFGNFTEPAYEYDADIYAKNTLRERRQEKTAIEN